MSSAPEGNSANNNNPDEPQAKRQKLDTHDVKENEGLTTPERVNDVQPQLASVTVTQTSGAQEAEISDISITETLLPPSRVLLGKPPSSHAQESSLGHTLEYDVGISEYISKDLPPIHAIIKQR